MARQPRWVATLLACVALAVGFALLAQWQVSRAVIEASVEAVDSETMVPLESILEPMTAQQLSDGGRRVSFDGSLDGRFVLVSGKVLDGVEGQWLVANVMSSGSCLPVVFGWLPANASVDSIPASDEVTTWWGRLVPSDDVLASDFQDPGRTVVAAADLVNVWECESIFDGYVISDEISLDIPDLVIVESRPPVPNTVLNWLNVFYALEWMAFGGFALYFWYRLVKDAVERELEAVAEAQP